MLGIRYATSQLICLFAVITAITPVYSCEFHDGFGGAPWAHFGQHSRANFSSLNPKEQIAKKSKLTVKVPSLASATRGEKTELKVGFNYNADDQDPSVQLLLDIGPAVTVVDHKSVILKTGKMSDFIT